ncbi:MAG TPA: hypothetical protein VEP90_09850 [Methylomirabilota bacterium]|nr:hypothetical protein [Methylomirabilota bacterium]
MPNTTQTINNGRGNAGKNRITPKKYKNADEAFYAFNKSKDV